MFRVETTAGTRYQIGLIVGLRARLRPKIERGADDALSGRDLCRGEEAGAPVGHRQQRLAVDRTRKSEAEQVRLSLAEEAVEVDVVTNDRPRTGKAAVEGDDGVEQPIHGEAAGAQVDAEVAGQK